MTESVSKPKILIVDDTPSNIMVLAEGLSDEHEILIATSGDTGLKRAFSVHPPDLVLLDVMMPGLDGYEVCRRLKQDERTNNIPVIFITAKNAEDDETKGLALGAVDYITKPFSLPIVRARVKTHLELKRKTDMLESLSSRDGLTGIYNRRKLNETLSLEWKRAIRAGSPLSLIMMDIDCFKAYNDNYGHVSGDECLKVVAFKLSSILRRSSDLIARYGGEEFAVVLPDTDALSAQHVSENIRKSVEAAAIVHEHSNVAGHITVSVGTATAFPRADTEWQLLVEIADNALYDAKNEGRNRVKQRVL